MAVAHKEAVDEDVSTVCKIDEVMNEEKGVIAQTEVVAVGLQPTGMVATTATSRVEVPIMFGGTEINRAVKVVSN